MCLIRLSNSWAHLIPTRAYSFHGRTIRTHGAPPVPYSVNAGGSHQGAPSYTEDIGASGLFLSRKCVMNLLKSLYKLFLLQLYTIDSCPPHLRSPEQRSPDPRSPDPRSPDLRSPDQRSPDPRSPDQWSPDQRNPDPRSPDQCETASGVARYPHGIQLFDFTCGVPTDEKSPTGDEDLRATRTCGRRGPTGDEDLRARDAIKNVFN